MLPRRRGVRGVPVPAVDIPGGRQPTARQGCLVAVAAAAAVAVAIKAHNRALAGGVPQICTPRKRAGGVLRMTKSFGVKEGKGKGTVLCTVRVSKSSSLASCCMWNQFFTWVASERRLPLAFRSCGVWCGGVQQQSRLSPHGWNRRTKDLNSTCSIWRLCRRLFSSGLFGDEGPAQMGVGLVHP